MSRQSRIISGLVLLLALVVSGLTFRAVSASMIDVAKADGVIVVLDHSAQAQNVQQSLRNQGLQVEAFHNLTLVRSPNGDENQLMSQLNSQGLVAEPNWVVQIEGATTPPNRSNNANPIPASASEPNDPDYQGIPNIGDEWSSKSPGASGYWPDDYLRGTETWKLWDTSLFTPSRQGEIVFLSTGAADSSFPDYDPAIEVRSIGISGPDDLGPGSNMINLVYGPTNNGDGGAGMFWQRESYIKVVSYKLGNGGALPVFNLQSALLDLANRADAGEIIDVVVIHPAYGGVSQAIADQINRLHNHGVFIVAANLNTAGACVNSTPGQYADICVGGIRTNGSLSPDTADGPTILSAGSGIVGYNPTAQNVSIFSNGAAFGSAYVGGAALMLRDRFPNWTRDQLREQLVWAASQTGYFNAFKALTQHNAGPPDTTPPLVTNHEPTGYYVGTNSVIKATFNEAMDQYSITGNTVVVIGPGGVYLTGNVGYSASTNTVEFHTTQLQPGQDYTVLLTFGIHDAAGNPLQGNGPSGYSWPFHTLGDNPSPTPSPTAGPPPTATPSPTVNPTTGPTPPPSPTVTPGPMTHTVVLPMVRR